MLVIVEGIDRVGKTTLIDKLVKEHNFKKYKHNPLVNYTDMDSANETDKVLQLFEMIELIDANVNIVIDRASWSDFVYGVIEREYDRDTAENNLRLIETHFNKLHGVLIYVRPTDIDRSSTEHGSSLKEHLDLFEEVMSNSNCNNLIYCDYNIIDWAIDKLMKGEY